MNAPSHQLIAQMRPAISAGWYYVPYEAVGGVDEVKALKRALTWRSKYSEGGSTPIRMYKDLPEQARIGVPRAYGQHRWNWLPCEDQTTLGVAMIQPYTRLPDPNHPAVKEPQLQAAFMRNMEQATRDHGNFIAFATTGSGKTVVSARNAALYGRRAAILVPLVRLMDQWHKELVNKLGISPDRIGIVQSDQCEFEDKDYILCMMKSLGQRQYPQEFYESVGQVYVDECHRIGTVELAMTTAKFPARVRVGLSATPERSDGSDRVIFWHIGPMLVRSEATAVRCEVYPMAYDDGGRMRGIPPLQKKRGRKVSDHGYRIKKLTEDDRRNHKLAEMVVRLWKARDPRFAVLAIGEHVGHVQKIMDICERMGVPRSVMGQCTGERHNANGTKTKIKSAEFNHAKETAEIVFATYGCFKEGIDEPRLAYGIDLSPVAKAKQVLGRIRRPFNGKTVSRWVTPVDVGDWMSMRYWRSRLRDYQADSEVRIIEARL